jgi:hypothetical protein
LESLLDEAKDISGYDVAAALDVMTNYLISDEGERTLEELSQQVVGYADSLGAESMEYLAKATQALAINDQVAAVKAFRSFQRILQRDGNIQDDFKAALPAPTASMQRFGRIISLFDGGGQTEISKFVPIIRKLAQEPRVQRTASEVVARLGERALSRSLRSVFGLPPPVFEEPQA